MIYICWFILLIVNVIYAKIINLKLYMITSTVLNTFSSSFMISKSLANVFAVGTVIWDIGVEVDIEVAGVDMDVAEVIDEVAVAVHVVDIVVTVDLTD